MMEFIISIIITIICACNFIITTIVSVCNYIIITIISACNYIVLNISSAMQNDFYNEDLALIQALVADFLIETNIYQYVPTEMHEDAEYIITLLVLVFL